MQYSFLVFIVTTIVFNGLASGKSVGLGDACNSTETCSTGSCKPTVFSGSNSDRCCVALGNQECKNAADCCGDLNCLPVDVSFLVFFSTSECHLILFLIEKSGPMLLEKYLSM